MEHSRTVGEPLVDLRTSHGLGRDVRFDLGAPTPELLAGAMSSRLEQLWVEAHRELRRIDLDDDAARRWSDALQQLVRALQAVEDAASPPSRSWGHRTWAVRRPQ